MADHDATCECADCTLARDRANVIAQIMSLAKRDADAKMFRTPGRRLLRDQRTDVKRNHHNSVARAPVTGDARNGFRVNGDPWRQPHNYASVLADERAASICTRDVDFITECCCVGCKPTRRTDAQNGRDKRAEMAADKARRKHP